MFALRGQAFLDAGKSLTQKERWTPSVQSIIGATDIFRDIDLVSLSVIVDQE
jgi:hypothetical protein